MRVLAEIVLENWKLIWRRTDCGILRKIFDTAIDILRTSFSILVGIILGIVMFARTTKSDWDKVNTVGIYNYVADYLEDNFGVHVSF